MSAMTGSLTCATSFGVDSLRAARKLREAGAEAVSLAGGLQVFAATSEFPMEAPKLT